MAEPRFDQFDGAAGADDGDVDLDRIERDGAQDIIGQAPQLQRIGSACLGVHLDRMGQQADRGGNMLFRHVPGAADQFRRGEMAGIKPPEIGHGVLFIAVWAGRNPPISRNWPPAS